jgi:hypothetical protein
MKTECRQQIIDGEIESYKLRLNQSNNEREDLLKTVKELEKKQKDLQIKYDANEQSWIRLKTDMSDKQRKVYNQFFFFTYKNLSSFFSLV